MIIVAAGGALDGCETHPTIGGAVERCIGDVKKIGIARIGSDATEIPTALPDAMIGRNAAPTCSCVVGAINAPFARIDEGVHAAAISAGSDSDADPSQLFLGEAAAGDLFPGEAAIGGFIKTAAITARGCVNAPRRAARLPQRGVNDVRISRIEAQIDGARVVILAKDLLPMHAAVG